MICIHCEAKTESQTRCSSCGESPLVAGEYRVLEVLGRGANATTYRAKRLDDGEVVALKELLVRNADSLKTLELFEREARTLEQLDHRGIPQYYDDLTVDLGANVGMYIAQEFVDGESLEEAMNNGPMDPHRVLRVLRGVAEVLDYLDDLKPPVVHRDIKPANIIDRGNDRIALIDFGSVRDIGGDAKTGVPTMAGTLGYMAPEQLMGRSTPASDVYALAVTAVALFTGRPPSEDLHDSDWEWSRELPDEVRQLLKRMLASRVANRPAADELLDEANDALAAFERQKKAEEKRRTALARVPETPRPIPSNFEHRFAEGTPLAWTVGVFTIFGMFVSATVFPPTAVLIFGTLGGLAIGGLLLKTRKERRRVRLFTEGAVVIGTADGIVARPEAPAMLHYSFELDGKTYRGTWSSMEVDISTRLSPGGDLLIFYDPSNPDRHRPLPEFLTGSPRLM